MNLEAVNDLAKLRSNFLMSGDEVSKVIRQEMATAISNRSNDEHLVIVWLNLDDFRCLNDCFGHWAGDDALQKVKDVLAHLSAIHCAKLYRYGGDDFLAFALTNDRQYHNSFGESIIKGIAELAIPLVDRDYSDRIKSNSMLSCTVAAVAFPLNNIDNYPNSELDRESKIGLVDYLIRLCDSILFSRKWAGRGKLATLDLCE
jgi:diguanylate cyclase (GGDEF)-like protein